MTNDVLTPKQLEAMTMRYVDRASLQQISRWLNISRDTVRARLRVARGKLALHYGRPIPLFPEPPRFKIVRASELDAEAEAEFLLFDAL